MESRTHHIDVNLPDMIIHVSMTLNVVSHFEGFYTVPVQIVQTQIKWLLEALSLFAITSASFEHFLVWYDHTIQILV